MAGTDILSLITYSYIKRFKMERRGQGPPFCHIKSAAAAVQEVTVAIARPGDALDRAFNGPQHPPKRARHASSSTL